MKPTRLAAERGASAVEFSLIVGVLVTLVFGIIDFGVVLHNVGAEREGTREGARQAVVATLGSNASCPLTPAPAVQQAKLVMCLTKDRIDAIATAQGDLRVRIQFGPSYAVGQPLRVCTEAPMKSTSGFLPFVNGGVLRSAVTMRIEEVDSSWSPPVATGYSETSLGGDWAWCPRPA